jgi:hypothetical protein
VGLTFGATRADQAGGVTLAQLNELTERATQEAIARGIDPATVEPRIRASFGGRIREISIEV